MKKIFLLFTIFSLVLTSCNPLEDVYDQIVEDPITGKVTITLTDEDYDELELGRYYFETEEEAKEKLPSLIKSLYPVWGQGSSVTVNFNISNEVSVTSYTVTEEDYNELGIEYFSSENDFESFFTYKFPELTEQGSVVNLTYLTTPEIVDYELTDADYDLVGNGRFNNFDIRSGAAEESIEVRREKIQTILLNNFPDNVPGVIYEVTYATYDGSVGQDTMQVVLTDNSPTDVAEYTLENADYELVGNGRYYNFDIRPGRAEESIEVRREKIETILLNNFPASVEGDFYLVTYAIYDGAAGTREMLLRFDGTNWNIFTALTYEFYTFSPVETMSSFVYNSDWVAPYSITDEDYAQMGQRFNNFDGRTEEARLEALRLLEVFLGQKYPFASTDDFVALEFKSFTGSGNETVNANFKFDGNSWVAIPTVVETSLGFVNNGTTWVQETILEYIFVDEDYDLIADTYRDEPGYENAVANLENYGNISTFNWNDEQVDAAVNTVLNSRFTDVEEDQKFAVTIFIYDGSSRNIVINYVYNSGVYTRL